MSAHDEILRILGKRRADLASEVHDALDVGGYLIEPDSPLLIQLDGRDRAITHTTAVTDGVELAWCGQTLVGIYLWNGFGTRAAR